MKKDERPEKTLFVITTDGMENASRYYSYEKIKKLVENRQKKHGWEFLFIGANIDSITEAARFGIGKDRAVNYVHDSVGTATVFASVGRAVGAVRSAQALCCSEALDASGWAREINEDYKKRTGKKSSKKSVGIGIKR